MASDEMLNAVFRFKHKAPSVRQDAAACRALARCFADFVATLEPVDAAEHKCGRLDPLADDRVVPASTFAVHEVDTLKKACQRLTASGGAHKRGDVWYDPWLPQYGCVLQRTKLNSTTVKIDVILVDSWERTLHFLPSRECVHGAVPKSHHVEHCADLDTDLEAKFTETFNSELSKAQASKGSERSAATNALGHQKTPAFIAAVVRRSVTELTEGMRAIENVKLSPNGGTTDVGQHTGGQPRDTCWPLVQAVISSNLCCGPGLLRKTIVGFHLNLLTLIAEQAENAFSLDEIDLGAGCQWVDDMFYMLQVIVQELVELLDAGYDVAELEEQCSELRASVNEFVHVLNYQTAQRYVLPESTVLGQLNKLRCALHIYSPERFLDDDDGESTEERHHRARRNLEGCSYLDGKTCTSSGLLQWGQSNDAPASYHCILALRTFECFIFEKSLLLSAKGTSDSTFTLEHMQTLVTQYQQVMKQWRQLPRLTSILTVEQRSREMMVMWIAFCLAHQRCVKEVPLCAEYNIALDWRDLKVAVLSDRAAISALQRVAAYIRSWNKRTAAPPLFHLTNQEPTFDFAQRFGLASTDMVSIYDLHVQYWEEYEIENWRVIETQKMEVADVRARIDEQQQNLSAAQRALAVEEDRLLAQFPPSRRRNRNNRTSRLKTQLNNEIWCINSELRQEEAALEGALAAPSYLVRPLPPGKNDAIQVIFMLAMPRNVEILGSLCLTAQRALLPMNATPEMTTLPKRSTKTWQQLYFQYAPSRALTGTSTVFTASPAPFTLPRYWGPQSVDEITSLSQYRAECVWDPSLRGTSLTWKDSANEMVNPFEATQSSVIESFTEAMPPNLGQLQWINEWPSNGGTRGNLVYANLHQQPDEFEKMAFIALGSLRAFPNQQYRKLQWALLDDILPWSNVCVAIVVRQSLYQVGALTDDMDPQFLWKFDMLKDKKGLKTFCATVGNIASKLDQTPRNFESVPLLSELASFALQYTLDARPIVKMFGVMARRWAEDARIEYKEESSPGRIAEIRGKECVLYGFALLAYTLGPWDNEAAQEVLEMNVLFRTSFFCASINRRSTDRMIRTESRIDEMMARRIAELVAYVENRGTHSVLSALVRLVSTTAPDRMQWKKFSEISVNGGQFGSCFEAFDDATDTHYSINLFTGVVLTNGFAPGGLPSEIRQHERFRSLFGVCNFEVFSTNGVLRTQRKYCDRLYDFALLVDGELFVQELTTDDSGAITKTLQLCSVSWIHALSDSLPARLCDLYTHWYWVERDCVLFRPMEAKCREVFFAATFEGEGSLQCYKVPFCDTKCSNEELMEQRDGYDRFVDRQDSLLSVFKILTKFEEQQFLHPLMSSAGVLKIELPRFKLTFRVNDDNQLESVEHKGYVLAPRQQLDDFLPRFRRYLLLELRDKSDTSRPELRMLLPVGSVVEGGADMVDIDIPINPDSAVDVACYDLHRRLKTFETETIGARLQLAAVCVRAGTNVPSKRLKMTGAETALQLLRACRSSRPFSQLERETLLTVCKLSYCEPAVKILAVSLLSDADRLAFLFGESPSTSAAMASADEKSEYADVCAARVQRNPLRSQFRSDEETLLLGSVGHVFVPISATDVVSCKPLPVAKDYVKSTEIELKQFIREARAGGKISPLPLNTNTTNAMSKGMLDELEVSWKSYHSQPQLKLKAAPVLLLEWPFKTLLNDVVSRRKTMETFLWSSFSAATSSMRDRLLGLINFVPMLTVSDVVRCAFDDETLHTLAPRFNEEGRQQFKKGVLLYMELCVLEDKVERLIWKAKHSGDLSDAQLVDELLNVREWQSTEFPFWLAFEVEGRLQIRHEQFVIARHLITSPGTVCQLNMGRGKTRVILPMLFLYFTRSRCPRVVRAHFLSPLLSEARQFMHRYLSASSARLGIFEQPFHRQIELNVHRLEFIRDSLQDLKLFGGVQMVAPEHRMSLELKRLEVEGEDQIVEILDEILDNEQFVDVLDECDALLHHKYHLVYAVGTPIPLSNGVERWKAAEALLRVVANGSQTTKVLQTSYVSCSSPDYATRLGAYEGTRLNTVVESTEELRDELKKALVLDLMDNAPFELMWLNTFGDTEARELLVTAITDASVSLEEALGEYYHKFTPYTSQLLALRGLVAFGVFEHCMEKRYRVDFGLPYPGSRPKKIVIPFRAADVPSERSEFSHPDVCIVLTVLGYYHGGLTDEEVRNAFRMLLRLDISEQDQQYSRWYSGVKDGLNLEDRKALCDVRHVSLADARQFSTLCRVYKFCMETINFYLNTCVFPKDTQQYPQRLSRTAWNLAAGENNIGFSGTNDNHRLLPLSVTQREPEEPSLLGTNGKMIDKILQVTQSYEVVRPSSDRSSIPWQCVLHFAIDKGAQALIDTGALLAGVSNHDAAEFLLDQTDFGFAGVTFYDNRKEHNCWMITEKAHRMKMPLKKASMLEKETFVIFDEARSRGSDMKLLPDAAAVLTLGPKLTKDKLMQGAGRMRQLGCNQTLWIASFDEVAQSILHTSGKSEVSSLTTTDMLTWVMDNTKAEAVHGLLEWAGNGIHFRKTQRDPSEELVDEDWSIETLYQEELHLDTIAQVIKGKMLDAFGKSTDALVSQICRRGFVYGLDDEVCVTSYTDECERELQAEEEVQQEKELEVMDCSPATEKIWAYEEILRVKSIKELYGVVQVHGITSFIRQWIAQKQLADLAWTRAKVFGTENFFSSVTARRGLDRVNEFLRVIDVMLVFKNGQVLLLSECEADHILELLWASPKCNFRFVNLAFACESVDRVGALAEFRDLALGSHINGNASRLSTVACHLYNGKTMLTKRQQGVVGPAFRELLGPVAKRETMLSNFIKSRGSSHKWTRSFLHELCCRMDLEDCK